MGSRHELGGKKGRYPDKCAQIVRKVLVNASANAKNKGEDPEYMYRGPRMRQTRPRKSTRSPPKGVRAVGGNYGYTHNEDSNLEFARVEIGIAEQGDKEARRKNEAAIKVTQQKC